MNVTRNTRVVLLTALACLGALILLIVVLRASVVPHEGPIATVNLREVTATEDATIIDAGILAELPSPVRSAFESFAGGENSHNFARGDWEQALAILQGKASERGTDPFVFVLNERTVQISVTTQ